eukprot:110502_1
MATDNYQLIFDILACIFKAGDETLLLFSIYDNTIKQYITEQYCLNLSVNNFPTAGSPEDQKILFKNLSHQSLNNDLYIICYIYRIGSLQTPDVTLRRIKASKKNKFKRMLRPYGATVFKLTKHIPSLKQNLQKIVRIEPGQAQIYCASNENDFMNIPFDIINGNTNSYYIAPLSIGIAAGYTLYNGSLDIVEKHYEYYDKLIMNMIEPITDGKWMSRNHVLLLTFLEARINPKRKKSACNVQIRMNFRDNDSYENISQIKYG